MMLPLTEHTLEKFGEIFIKNCKNLLSPLKFSEKCVNFCKIGAKVPKNQRNLEWCKGKNVELEKR